MGWETKMGEVGDLAGARFPVGDRSGSEEDLVVPHVAPENEFNIRLLFFFFLADAEVSFDGVEGNNPYTTPTPGEFNTSSFDLEQAWKRVSSRTGI